MIPMTHAIIDPENKAKTEHRTAKRFSGCSPGTVMLHLQNASPARATVMAPRCFIT